MGRKRRETKEKKRKPVNYVPIERTHAGKVTEPYAILDELIEKHHGHLLEAEAKILIGWDQGPAKEDADGFTKVGRVKKGSDIDRAHGKYDFLVTLRKEVFNSFDATRKHAELDRLLCRCAVKRDGNGEIATDEKDRSIFRLRKPVEVFPENVARYGFHQEPKLADCLARFNDSKRPLLNDADKPKRGRKFSEPATGEAATNGASSNGHAAGDDYRTVTVDELDGLPAYVKKALNEAGLTTLGAIAKQETTEGTLAGIKGLSDRGIELLQAAIKGYRLEHPEKFEQAAA